MRYKKLTIPTIRLTVILFLLHVVLKFSFAQPVSSQNQGVRFTDVTAELGIEFRHVNGERGKKYFIEPIGSGVASLILTMMQIWIFISSR